MPRVLHTSGEPSSSTRLHAKVHRSDIVLPLPADTSVSFEVETYSGRIDNELGPPAKKTAPWTTGSQLEFSAGAGDANVRLIQLSSHRRARGQGSVGSWIWGCEGCGA